MELSKKVSMQNLRNFIIKFLSNNLIPVKAKKIVRLQSSAGDSEIEVVILKFTFGSLLNCLISGEKSKIKRQ